MLKKVLLVEDETNVGSTLFERLSLDYNTSWARTAQEACNLIRNERFDLVLLDIGLPDGNGFEVAEFIRSRERKTALLFLTAFASPEDRIRGLELGAEDYVLKPFHLRELLLRIQNALRRSTYLGEAPQDLQIGKALVRLNEFEVEVDQQTFPLSHKECSLLELLVQRRGKAVSREEILGHVWTSDEQPTSRTIDNFIVKLRKMVEPNPEKPTIIRSIRGVGYQLL